MTKTSQPPNLPAERMRALVQQLVDEDADRPQSAIAKLMGITQAQVSQYKDGERFASAKMVERVVHTMGISRDFFWDPRHGDAPDYRDFLDGRAPDASPEFLEWERVQAPTLRPPLQAHERAQMVAVKYHRGALEKYSRLLSDLRDGLSDADILAEAEATSAAQAEADAMGVKRRER